MTIFRSEHLKNYTVVNNSIIKDPRLSWKAKGIWLYAFSRPNDWTFHMNDIVNQSTDGKDSVTAGLKELERYGYLLRARTRDSEGQFLQGAEWVFYEISQLTDTFEPEPENPILDNPVLDNPPLLSTDIKLSTEARPNTEATDDDDARAHARATPCGKVDNSKITLSDVHFNCLKQKKDWLPEEIDKAWTAYVKYSGNVSSPLEYIESIIMKNRVIQKNKENSCSNLPPKKNPELMKKKETPSIDTSATCKENSSDKNMSEPPLASYIRQLALKKKLMFS
jgi:hypothetical protein